uniref:Uncharacterized protein n=1 Tax=Gasterosteus aculeatus aculeatus TaxID=481459 RepID=A0AAQ4QTB0_GASAC
MFCSNNRLLKMVIQVHLKLGLSSRLGVCAHTCAVLMGGVAFWCVFFALLQDYFLFLTVNLLWNSAQRCFYMMYFNLFKILYIYI